LYSSRDIIRRWNQGRWAEYVARMGERNTYKISVWKSDGEGRDNLGFRRMQYNIKTYLIEVRCEGLGWLKRLQDRVLSRHEIQMSYLKYRSSYQALWLNPLLLFIKGAAVRISARKSAVVTEVFPYFPLRISWDLLRRARAAPFSSLRIHHIIHPHRNLDSWYACISLSNIVFKF
jgi:hypothetical protein